MPITHGWTTAASDNPAHDVSAGELNAHSGTMPQVIDHGTSFPGSPATNDLYFRTDRSILYFYDGTRWLSVQEYRAWMGYVNNDSSGSDLRINLAGDYQIYVTNVTATMLSTGLTGGAYWVITFAKKSIADGTTALGTINNQSGANSTWIAKTTTINAVVDNAAFPLLQAENLKTSTPGNLSYSATINYRLIG